MTIKIDMPEHELEALCSDIKQIAMAVKQACNDTCQVKTRDDITKIASGITFSLVAFLKACGLPPHAIKEAIVIMANGFVDDMDMGEATREKMH